MRIYLEAVNLPPYLHQYIAYSDLITGVETISHIRENSRLTIMFCAFEGPPRIVRLWGAGRVYEFDTPEYNALIPLEKRQPGSRSVVSLNVQKVSTVCFLFYL